MGWMPDVFGTYDRLTAVEVLGFAAAAHHLSGPAVDARITELLAAVHLSEFAVGPSTCCRADRSNGSGWSGR